MGTAPVDAATRTAGRDRFVDALRVGSLVVVVLGHWLMADVRPDGEVSNALVSVPALEPLTWVLQVMPLFFLVGGVAHTFALASLERRL
ncbi:MAG: acyltransferase, partial [Actinomycetota bacterium]